MRRPPHDPGPVNVLRALGAGLAALALAGCATAEPPGAQAPPSTRSSATFASLTDWNLEAANLQPRGDQPLHGPLRAGFRYVLERGDDPAGDRRLEVRVLEGTEPFDVAGLGRFECAVVQSEELKNGVLARQVQEWFAIDTTTRALYTFGAVSWAVDSTGEKVFDGMWRVGDGDDGQAPEPALVVPGRWVKGERHRAAARGSGAAGYLEIMESGIEVEVPAGTFTDCVRIREVSLDDSTRFTDRWWCPAVGLARDRDHGMLVASDALKSDLSAFGRHHRQERGAKPQATRITPEQAQAIALEQVPGTFRSIVIERRGNVNCYAVEIIARDGVETDVFIDVATGKVVATER